MGQTLALSAIMRSFGRAGVLIVSDAGAARGNRDVVRADRTADFLRTLRRTNPWVAWLNPVPLDRWEGTTAAEVRDRGPVPMFSLDPAGLYSAVDILRGRTT